MAAVVTSNRLYQEARNFTRMPEERAHEICKIKGITLNYNNSLIVNFNSIRKLIMEREKQEQEEEREEKTTGTALNLRFKSTKFDALRFMKS